MDLSVFFSISKITAFKQFPQRNSAGIFYFSQVVHCKSLLSASFTVNSCGKLLKIMISVQVIRHMDVIDRVQSFILVWILLLYHIVMHKILTFYVFSGY